MLRVCNGSEAVIQRHGSERPLLGVKQSSDVCFPGPSIEPEVAVKHSGGYDWVRTQRPNGECRIKLNEYSVDGD